MGKASSKKLTSMKTAFLKRFAIIIVLIIAMISLVAVSIATTGIVTDNSEEKTTLYEAINAHHKWATNLNTSINYGVEFTGSTDPTACDFGKYIYSDATQNNPSYTEFLKVVEPMHKNLHESAKSALTAMETNKTQAQTVYIKTIAPEIDKLVAEINKIIDLRNAELDTAQTRLDRFIIVEIVVCIIAAVCIFLACFNIYVYVKRQIVLPVAHIENESEKLAKGQLSLDFDVTCKNRELTYLSQALGDSISEIKKYINAIDDGMAAFADGDFTFVNDIDFIGDFSQIRDSIKTFQQKMQSTLSEISSASAQVYSSSEQVSSSAQSLAQSSTEQASSVEELSATISNISNQIAKNAENSQLADKLGKKTRAVVDASTEEMQQLTNAINEIQSTSERIGNIIKTIEDIAFQTNILALNAAVEAARAGEAGKGFAVVADEVRNLAQKSAEAAKNTTELIESSLNAVNRGTSLAVSTGTAFSEVSVNAQDLLTVIEKIAVASKEQADSVSQITIGVDQISAVVQTNSATSQQSAAASEELSGQANMMKELISQFTLNDDSSATSTSYVSKNNFDMEDDFDFGTDKY